MDMYDGWAVGLGGADGGAYRSLVSMAQNPESLTKALTTGTGIVAADATGGQALRIQFLHGKLEQALFAHEDATTMQWIGVEKAHTATFEWSMQTAYGAAGDGFIGEAGSDGAFGLTATDGSLARRVKELKFLGVKRIASLKAMLTQSVSPVQKVQETEAALDVIGKCNLAIHFGDSRVAGLQFDGTIEQIRKFAEDNTEYQDICYDAAGQPLDDTMLNSIAGVCRHHFGRGSRLLQSIQGYGDTEALLFPRARHEEGTRGTMGSDRSKFLSRFGEVQRYFDPMFNPGWPTRVAGVGADGKPLATADTGAATMSATPFTAATAAGASTTSWLANRSTNAASASATYPAVPTGIGNQGNRLDAGTYYYAMSVVRNGLESLPWIHGASSAGLAQASSATGVVVTSANNVVRFTVDATVMSGIVASGIYAYTNYKVRLYRCSSKSTDRNDWALVCDFGLPGASGTIYTYDNGMYIPGYDSAVLFTESRGGAKGVLGLELLPMMKRQLPDLDVGAQFAYLYFYAPIMLFPGHHVWVRNIGPGPTSG
jgi:hypothetical protein